MILHIFQNLTLTTSKVTFLYGLSKYGKFITISQYHAIWVPLDHTLPIKKIKIPDYDGLKCEVVGNLMERCYLLWPNPMLGLQTNLMWIKKIN